ncbi:hypothetical protein HYPSUDRAFT_204951 [Hypholoma sublateritium FD-334 SS-4]|uniref:Uncharacterized protein n=1 Tax=Hypholoma sublateritium (strain FD-334 SS-4) TaxID=945553 RepID=A0A0D2NQI5_HYPSF|nr:hypothetical protein HYPSUDRAFT_204951 [Hypholoma sublateritium FD-334 SS-4]
MPRAQNVGRAPRVLKRTAHRATLACCAEALSPRVSRLPASHQWAMAPRSLSRTHVMEMPISHPPCSVGSFSLIPSVQPATDPNHLPCHAGADDAPPNAVHPNLQVSYATSSCFPRVHTHEHGMRCDPYIFLLPSAAATLLSPRSPHAPTLQKLCVQRHRASPRVLERSARRVELSSRCITHVTRTRLAQNSDDSSGGTLLRLYLPPELERRAHCAPIEGERSAALSPPHVAGRHFTSRWPTSVRAAPLNVGTLLCDVRKAVHTPFHAARGHVDAPEYVSLVPQDSRHALSGAICVVRKRGLSRVEIRYITACAASACRKTPARRTEGPCAPADAGGEASAPGRFSCRLPSLEHVRQARSSGLCFSPLRTSHTKTTFSPAPPDAIRPSNFPKIEVGKCTPLDITDERDDLSCPSGILPSSQTRGSDEPNSNGYYEFNETKRASQRPAPSIRATALLVSVFMLYVLLPTSIKYRAAPGDARAHVIVLPACALFFPHAPGPIHARTPPYSQLQISDFININAARGRGPLRSPTEGVARTYGLLLLSMHPYLPFPPADTCTEIIPATLASRSPRNAPTRPGPIQNQQRPTPAYHASSADLSHYRPERA